MLGLSIKVKKMPLLDRSAYASTFTGCNNFAFDKYGCSLPQ